MRRTRRDLEVCEETQIRGELVCGRAEARERGKYVDVNFAGVGLRRDRVCVAEARQLSNTTVKLLNLDITISVYAWQLENRDAYFVVVTVEQGEETGLCASCAFDATEAEVITSTLNVAQIPQELLQED